MKATDVQQPRAAILQAVVPFFAVTICGSVLSAVVGLFAYANVPNPDSHDSRFLTIMIVGVSLSLIAGALFALRAVRSSTSESSGVEYSLLKKYRRADVRPGADAQAGEYKIGETYLRELLGRRRA